MDELFSDAGFNACSQNFGVGGTGTVGGRISNRFLSYAGVGNGTSLALLGAVLSGALVRRGVVRSRIASKPPVSFDLKPPVLGEALLLGVDGDLSDLPLLRDMNDFLDETETTERAGLFISAAVFRNMAGLCSLYVSGNGIV